MTAMATPIERRQFGELADDIAYLRRGCGLTVAPFADGFRIGTDVFGEDGVRQRAERERDVRARAAADRERRLAVAATDVCRPKSITRAVAQSAVPAGPNHPRKDAPQDIPKRCQTVEIDDGAAAVVESNRWTKKPRANAPEIKTGLAGEAAAPAPIKDVVDAPSVENAREGFRAESLVAQPPAVADIGERPRILWLGLELLAVDKRYQRDIGKNGLAHINRIAREFNWNRFQPVIVSERADGTFAVIDGQHRLEAARKNQLVTDLPCYIVAAPDIAAEAAIFADVNTRRLGLTPHARFWAAKAADDPIAIAVYEVATRLGVKILRGNPTGLIPPMCVNSPLALQRTLSRFGKAALSMSIGLIAETHAETPSAFRSSLIIALASIAASREFSRERMKRTLTGLDLDQLYENARLERITGRGTLETATERVLRKAYDA